MEQEVKKAKEEAAQERQRTLSVVEKVDENMMQVIEQEQKKQEALEEEIDQLKSQISDSNTKVKLCDQL